jgi:hypothetical protein
LPKKDTTHWLRQIIVSQNLLLQGFVSENGGVGGEQIQEVIG